jgi:C-terminal processing protease CtpA/Prc
MKTLVIIKRFLIVALLVFIVSCEKGNDDEVNKVAVNREIYYYMLDIYLWYEYLPAVNFSNYSTPEAFLEALRYRPLDKWSAILTKEEFNQYFEEGKMIGYGISLAVDNANKIRVAFAYRSTQAYNNGVRRGWIINKVNGIQATPENVMSLLGNQEIGIRNNIEFLNEQNNPVTLNLTKEEISITPVLYYDTIQWNNEVIGYMVFQDFIDAAKTELDEAFTFFIQTGVDDIIIDMRYNGGGSVEVAQYLAKWILGKEFSGNPLVKFKHNIKNSRYDTTLNIPAKADGLSFERLYFIGTRGTASASELVINGAKPYVEVFLGGDSTHGKPVGMYALPLKSADYVLLPVSFKYANANDEGDFYDGIAPDFTSPDDITKDFGNPDENSLESMLNYITTGTASFKDEKSTRKVTFIERPDPVGVYLKAF